MINMTVVDGFFDSAFTESVESSKACNLTYMIQCSKYRMQYIGETKRQLSDRFGEHRRAIKKAINASPF